MMNIQVTNENTKIDNERYTLRTNTRATAMDFIFFKKKPKKKKTYQTSVCCVAANLTI